MDKYIKFKPDSKKTVISGLPFKKFWSFSLDEMVTILV